MEEEEDEEQELQKNENEESKKRDEHKNEQVKKKETFLILYWINIIQKQIKVAIQYFRLTVPNPISTFLRLNEG